MKILKSLAAILQQENMTLEDATSCIREDTKYQTIRVEEPDLFRFQPLPLLQFSLPTFSGKTLIRSNTSLQMDKIAIPDFTLNKFYFSRNYERTDHMLDAL